MLPRLLLCAAAQDAQQPATPLPHLSDPLAEGGLNPMHIPAVRGSYVAGLAAHGVDVGARHRRMQAHPETGAMPHLHDKFDFIGITDAGFVDFKYNAVVANTTINTDDYVSHKAHSSARDAPHPRRTALVLHRAVQHHVTPLHATTCRATLHNATLRLVFLRCAASPRPATPG